MEQRTLQIADRSAFKARLNAALEFDPREAVALTIDLQREYLDESVGQSVVEPQEAERVMAASKTMLDACRAADVPVVHAYVVRRDVERERGFHSGGLAYIAAAQELGASQMPHRGVRTRPDRPAGSPESDVPAALVADGDVHITEKKSLDSFRETDLEFLLRRIFRAKYVVVAGGINTDTCVYSTVFSAANLGYAPIVVRDCVASMRGADSHEMALELMARSIAWVFELEEFLPKIKA